MKRNEHELNKANNQNEHLLNDESKKYMIDIACYLRTKNVDSYEIEVIRNDILRIFLDAQNRGETIDKILGSDYKSFCDGILQSTGYRKKRNIICEWIDCLLSAFLVLVAITFLFSGMCSKVINHIFHGIEFDWVWGITSGNLITWSVLIVAVFVFLFVATNASLSKGKKHSRTINFLFGACLMVVLLAMAYITKTYFYNVIFYIHLGVLGVAFLIGYVMHRLLKSCS